MWSWYCNLVRQCIWCHLTENLLPLFWVSDGKGCQLSCTWQVKIVLSITRVLRHLHIEPQPLFSLAVLMSSSVQSNGYNMASLVQLTTKCSDDVTAEMSFAITDNQLWEVESSRRLTFLSSWCGRQRRPLNGVVDVQANTILLQDTEGSLMRFSSLFLYIMDRGVLHTSWASYMCKNDPAEWLPALLCVIMPLAPKLLYVHNPEPFLFQTVLRWNKWSPLFAMWI